MARFIEYQRVTLPDLPFRVLDQAFYKPQSAKLWERGRAKQQEAANRSGTRLSHHLKAQWALEETWIGHSLHAILAGVPARVLAASIRTLCDGFAIAQPALHRLRTRGVKQLLGDPDFILKGVDATVLGEIKVGAKKTNHRYSLQQHRKFITHGAIRSCFATDPHQVCHLLIVPDLDPRKFCDDFRHWRPEVVGHRLKFQDEGKLKAHISGVIRNELLRDEIKLSRSRIDNIEKLEPDEIVPSFVYSWNEFSRVVRDQLQAVGLEEYIESVDRLESLAYGLSKGSMPDGCFDGRLGDKRHLDAGTGGLQG